MSPGAATTTTTGLFGMLREPKTNRPVMLAALGSGYTVLVILQTGDTLKPTAFWKIRALVHTEDRFLAFAVAVLLCELLAIVLPPGTKTRDLLRIGLLAFATAAWTIFGGGIFTAAPIAILPGYALVMVCCNALALFDALRPQWSP